jgi:hypothetical protein
MTPMSSDDKPPAFTSNVSEWTQPLWLHPSAPVDRPGDPPSPDVVRDFARMAAPIGLAAWMLGTALTTSCAPVDLAGTAPNAAHSIAPRGAVRMPAGPIAAAVPLCASTGQVVAVSAPRAR